MNADRNQADTVEIPVPGSPPRASPAETGSARAQVDLAALSDRGHVRSANEDHYVIVRFGRTLETLLTSLPADEIPARSEEVGYGLLLADGMGGRAAGEVASRKAISTMIGLVLQTPDWIMGNDPQDVEQVMERFADRYRRIHAALRHEGEDDPSLSGMGTTMTLACSLGARVVIGHIGDSRAYLFRDGQLFQLTRDHTLAQALVDMGQLTAEQAARHPARHMLTRSLGAAEDSYPVDVRSASLADGDRLLLCTDGLTNMVDDATIASLLSGAASSQEACQALVAKALERGGKDNVTVALARYRFPR
jgi:protein phosphatase